MFLEVDQLSHSFGLERILSAISFDLAEGEVVSIVGPSGVGKTTLLNILAGLEQPERGSVRFATPPSKAHPVILVFQDYVLFPNMTVFENVAFGLRARRLVSGVIQSRVQEMLGWFGLADKAGAYPAQLSAGQRQRVAIARAMIVEPMLLLLDEPFANLDRGLKLQTAEFIRDTQKQFGVTTIAVTHDLEEAFVMSDRIGVLLGGHLEQYDTPQTVYARPASHAVANFLGPVNVIDGAQGHVLGVKDVPQAGALLVRPECVMLRKDAGGGGVVTLSDFAGHYTKIHVAIGTYELVAYGPYESIQQGDRVHVEIRDCHTSEGES